MAVSGQAKAEYQPEYMRRKRNGSLANPVATCSFCGEAGSSDRLLVGDQDCIICEECITLAVARIAEAVGGDNKGYRKREPEGAGPRSRVQIFSEPLDPYPRRRRMRRRSRPRVLTSVRTAARNFDLLLAIATPSTSVPSFSRGWNDSDSVWRQQGGRPRWACSGPYLADCNSFRFAATALNLMRNVRICSTRACCSAGGSLRAVSKSLAAMFSRSCIFIATLHFAVQSTTDLGKRRLPGIGLNAQGEQRWRAMRRSRYAGCPIHFREPPLSNSPPFPDSPAAFLESPRGNPAPFIRCGVCLLHRAIDDRPADQKQQQRRNPDQ